MEFYNFDTKVEIKGISVRFDGYLRWYVNIPIRLM